LQRRLTEEGVTFADLLTEVRVQLAHTLLVEESLPVVQVAARLGYADAAAFGRAFKRWTGKSPGSFRPR
jgi:AraC-like DNA-binding protein